jgi:hypothetical protein
MGRPWIEVGHVRQELTEGERKVQPEVPDLGCSSAKVHRKFSQKICKEKNI